MFAYKVVMVGDFGVGKTSLVKRYVDNSFSEEYLSTIGVSISKKTLTNSTQMLWDIEGHTEFKPLFKQYLMGAKGFIIVADLQRQNTIDSIQKHIELCHAVVKDAPICIALNKCDLDYSLSQEAIQKIADSSSSIVAIFKSSAKDGVTVLEIFETLDTYICEQLKS